MTISYPRFQTGSPVSVERVDLLVNGLPANAQAKPAPRKGVYRALFKRAFDVTAIVLAAPIIVPIVAALAGGAVVIERGVDSDRPHAVSSVPATDGVKDGPLFDELKVDKPAARKKRVARQSRTEREGEDNRRAIEANDSAAQDPREITQVPEGSGMSGDPNDAVPESAPEDTGFNVGLDQ